MKQENGLDIVDFLEKIFDNLNDYAHRQNVTLHFKSTMEKLYANYNQSLLEAQIVKFISRIIAFTPKNNTINVFFGEHVIESKYIQLIVINSGVDLSRLRELKSLIDYKVKVNRIEIEGTQFTIDVPLIANNLVKPNFIKEDNLKFNPYHIEINKRLSTYFSNLENLENLATEKCEKEGAFLKRVNIIIKRYMHNNEFNVEKLANSMSLSRTQLYRKLKVLTQMSPIQYILFTRLQIAKELLSEGNLDLNISEIGYKVGFISNSHFSRAFKKQFDINPSQLLKNKTKYNI